MPPTELNEAINCNLGDGTLCFSPRATSCLFAGMCAEHCTCPAYLEQKKKTMEVYYAKHRDEINSRKREKRELRTLAKSTAI